MDYEPRTNKPIYSFEDLREYLETKNDNGVFHFAYEDVYIGVSPDDLSAEEILDKETISEYIQKVLEEKIYTGCGDFSAYSGSSSVWDTKRRGGWQRRKHPCRGKPGYKRFPDVLF